MAQLWKIGYRRTYNSNPYVNPVGEIVFKRHECQWVLPASLASHLFNKSNPKHFPVVQLIVVLKAESVTVWEVGGTRLEFDRILLSVGRPNEDYYLHMSITRIKHGHRAWTPTSLPPQVPYQ